MKLLIAGSRSITKLPLTSIDALIESHSLRPTVILCGCCTGVDQIGYNWARLNLVKVEFFPAWPGQKKWAESVVRVGEIIHPIPVIQGKISGFIRNSVMAMEAQTAILFHDGQSRGTSNMKDLCIARNIPYFIERIQL